MPEQQNPSRSIFHLSAIIAVIWVGVFGFIAGAGGYLTSDQMFILIQEGLLAGVGLTILIMVIAWRLLRRPKVFTA